MPTKTSISLVLGAQKGHIELVRFLIESGANRDRGIT